MAPNPPADSKVSSSRPAAIYVRMSTEHQQFSTENQAKVLREYAESRGYAIVKTYLDEGKSGLRLEGRDALRQLINDVQADGQEYQTILVYDISRWGRFQDADESAYYEYICRRSGIEVQYCAEQFENDGSPQATIIKSVKRAMAGEYSRELSVKVFQGQCTLTEKGFRQGGTAGYGLRRMLIDHTGTPKGILKRGERKSLQTDRVILVPGPVEERKIVQQIYEWFVRDGKNEAEITKQLYGKGVPPETGASWSKSTVHEILTNEKYIGNNVRNRTSFKLKKRHVKNPPEMWVRSDGAFKPIVDAELFYMAQGIIQERSRRFSNEQMLELLKALYERHQTVSGILIDEADGMPSSSAYRQRFGSLIRAYRLIGYSPERDYEYIEINRALRRKHAEVVRDTIRQLADLKATADGDERSDLLLINGEFTASIVIARCRKTDAGRLRWLIRLEPQLAPDITIVVRMDAANDAALDYYLLPRIDVAAWNLRLAEFNGAALDTYRFDTLEYFWFLAERARLRVAS
ncbi:MAG: recombinase family protein [Pirellulales bacterium]|nr:recombinase family protein [Pirellulales bacterium]